MRLHHRLDSLMLTIGIGWAAFAVGAEVGPLRAGFRLAAGALDIRGWPALAVFLFGSRISQCARPWWCPLVLRTGHQRACWRSSNGRRSAWITAIVSGGVLLRDCVPAGAARRGFGTGPPAGRHRRAAPGGAVGGVFARGADGQEKWQFPISIGAATAIVVLLAGVRAGHARNAGSTRRPTSSRWALHSCSRWPPCSTSSAHPARWGSSCSASGPGAARVLERRRVRIGEWVLPATVIGIALLLQANLLRWLGPAGDLNALDIFDMGWRALVSLLWASIGAALTINGRRMARGCNGRRAQPSWWAQPSSSCSSISVRSGNSPTFSR